MEDSMCWEMDYWYYAEQEKAKKAKAREERDAGVIKNLLNEANQEADKTNTETAPVKEVVPAK
jgi:DNA replication protein DnaC